MGSDEKYGVGPGRLSRQGSKNVNKERRWFYQSVAGAIKEVRIVRIWTSILRRQNTVAQFIETRPILDLCEKA